MVLFAQVPCADICKRLGLARLVDACYGVDITSGDRFHGSRKGPRELSTLAQSGKETIETRKELMMSRKACVAEARLDSDRSIRSVLADKIGISSALKSRQREKAQPAASAAEKAAACRPGWP